MTDQIGADREVFIALSNPVSGREAEFDEWYGNVHIPEVLELPGFLSAQRYRIAGSAVQEGDFQYLTVYQIEGSAAEARDRLFGAGFAMSDALDRECIVFAPYAPLGAPLQGPGGAG